MCARTCGVLFFRSSSPPPTHTHTTRRTGKRSRTSWRRKVTPNVKHFSMGIKTKKTKRMMKWTITTTMAVCSCPVHRKKNLLLLSQNIYKLFRPIECRWIILLFFFFALYVSLTVSPRGSRGKKLNAKKRKNKTNDFRTQCAHRWFSDQNTDNTRGFFFLIPSQRPSKHNISACNRNPRTPPVPNRSSRNTVKLVLTARPTIGRALPTSIGTGHNARRVTTQNRISRCTPKRYWTVRRRSEKP